MGEKYTILGWQWGVFETTDGRRQSYASLHVMSPVKESASPDYHAVGYKTEKLKCTGPEVWEKAGLVVGDDAILYFGRGDRVTGAEHIEKE